jgi:hypothetical protein
VEKKPIKLLLAPKEVWQCFFYKVKLTWKKVRTTRKDEEGKKMEEWL